MTDNTVTRKPPPSTATIIKVMNNMFDSEGAQAGIHAGDIWLNNNGLVHFPTAEANAVMATMYLHANDALNYAKFKAAMMECKDLTETIRLNLKRNHANWLFRRGEVDEAEAEMRDPGFKSPDRPEDEKKADELISYVGRLLNRDKAATMLERLFHQAYDLPLSNATYLRNMCWWASAALYSVGRNKDATVLARILTATGDNADPVMGPEPSRVRVTRLKLLMGLRFKPLQWAAARFAVHKYRLKK